MKKIALCFFVFWTSICFAQMTGSSIRAGMAIQAMRSGSFADFAKSYNSVFANTLTQKTDPEKTANGFALGAGIRMDKLCIGIEYYAVQFSTEAIFSDGAVRNFKLRDQGTAFFTGFELLSQESAFDIEPLVGFSLGGNKLFSTYQSGSNGNSGSALSGTYIAYSGKTIIGLEAAYGTPQVKVFARGTLIGRMFSPELYDREKETSDPDHATIATDYASFISSPAYNYSGDHVRGDFRGARITFGIRFDFIKY